ncbi:response regulator [bacterium]|nr:response regulator [bacterium]
MRRILLVEDDAMMGKAVKVALSQAGYAVDLFENAEDGESALHTTKYDLVLLDINLPGKSGLDLARDMRRLRHDVPIMALTARDATKQKVEGFSAGVDDYVVKPFDLDELLARMQALIRRSDGRQTPYIENGPILIDPGARTVRKNGSPVELSAREFAIFAILMENLGKVMNKQEIEDKLYGWDIAVESNTVEVHISHLRKKLGDAAIKTIRGLGYVVEKIA